MPDETDPGDKRAGEPQADAIPFENVRKVIFGDPLATTQLEQSTLPKLIALPVFCSDAISSVAYATQQILLALCMAGLWLPALQGTYTQYTLQITFTIIAVLLFVSVSYWQTIFAYPGGGGSYIVSKENLGTTPGLIAAAALLIDYVLCVAVSIASGVQNLRDLPILASLNIGDHMTIYCLLGIMFMAWMNLRGLKDPGSLFAIPVYTFVLMSYLLIAIGLFAPAIGWTVHTEFANQTMPQDIHTHTWAIVLAVPVLLRAFATGCSALTGVEAVSNGIPAFRLPKSRNAAITLTFMALILGTLFTGISLLATKYHIVYWEGNGATASAVIDQLSGTVFGKTGAASILYYVMQFSTALILLVAAQTSFADFPRVSSILASDGFMPRQLSHLGDRLAFDNGIVILAILSSIFVIIGHGSVDQLIPFFTIGVFLAFTLSQAGMVVHWFKLRSSHWTTKALINGFGATSTAVVLCNIVFEKFIDGAWLVILLIGILLIVFFKISNHYRTLSRQLEIKLPPHTPLPALDNKVYILVQGVHAGTLHAMEYALSISPKIEALHVEIHPERTIEFKQAWSNYFEEIPLVILASDYRSLITPLMNYLDQKHRQNPEQFMTIIILEYAPTKWWQSLLHGQTGLLLKVAFLNRQDVAVTNIRYSGG